MFHDAFEVNLLLLVLILFGCCCFFQAQQYPKALEIIAYQGKVSSVGATWCTCEKKDKKIEQTHIKNKGFSAIEVKNINGQKVKFFFAFLDEFRSASAIQVI